jgi:hypothetical protein
MPVTLRELNGSCTMSMPPFYQRPLKAGKRRHFLSTFISPPPLIVSMRNSLKWPRR